jgi:hypothetical protein
VKILELKRSLNFALQNDANRDIGSAYYDLENYEEEEEDIEVLPGIENVAAKTLPTLKEDVL